MKFLLTALCLLTAAPAGATEVTLTAYTNSSNYSSSAYSFRHLSQDRELTRNHYELLYTGGELDTSMVVGDIGTIVDLGERSCSAIENPYEQPGEAPAVGSGGYPYAVDRQRQPMFWLTYSEAWNALLRGPRTSRTSPIAGHCYLVHSAQYDGLVVALFRVTTVNPGVSVTIDEIETFTRRDFARP